MNIVILLAAGVSKRMHSSLPKQFINVLDKPLIYYSLDSFQKNQLIDEVVIVTKSKYFKTIYQIIEQYNFDKVHMLVEGGKTRQMSTYNALKSLHGFVDKNDLVIIHDSARPNIDERCLNNLIETASKKGAASLGVKVTNTTVVAKNNRFISNVNRDNLISIQTPQAFKFVHILRAHNKALKENVTNASDDAQLMALINKSYYIVLGSSNNIKLTTPEDLSLLEILLRRDE